MGSNSTAMPSLPIIEANTTVEPVAIGEGKFRLNSTDTIPNKLWAGFYNLSLIISWNVTHDDYYIVYYIFNSSLAQLHLLGDAVISNQSDFQSTISPGQLLEFYTIALSVDC